MLKTFTAALTGVLQKQNSFVIADALNRNSRAAALLPHTHNSWELVVLADDRVVLNPPKVLHDIQENLHFSVEIDLLKVSCVDHVAGTFHTWYIPEELYSIHLTPELLNMLMQVYPAPQISQQLFSAAVSSLIHVLKNIGSSSKKCNAQENAQRLVNFLQDRCQQLDLSLEQLAEIFNLSPQYMNRLLRKNGYPSVHAMLTEIRLVKAKELFDCGDGNIKNVVRLTGWRNSSYFSSCFKRRWGVTPQAYLAKLRKDISGDDENREVAV